MRAVSSTPVPFERTTTWSPLAIPRRSASGGASSTSARGPQELRARARARRRRRRRAGGTGGGEARRRSARRRAPGAAPAPASSPPRAARRACGAGSGARSPMSVEREVAEEARAQLVVDARRVGRQLDVEPLGELADPGELVRARRERRPAQPLDAALEVHRRPVALERGGRGEDHVGPARRRGRGTSSARSRARPARRARGRSGPTAASSPETMSSSIGSGFASSRVGCDRPGGRDAAPVRRAPAGGRRRSRACPRSRARARARRCGRRRRRPGPDQTSTARSAARSRFPSAFRGSASSAHLRRASAGLGRDGAGRRARDDLGAAASRLLDPEVDDRRALGDRVVADDDHEARRRRSPRAAAGTRRARPTSPPGAPPSARRARGAGARRARTRSPSSPTRRARSRSSRAPRAGASRPRRAPRPRRSPRSPSARAAAAS